MQARGDSRQQAGGHGRVTCRRDRGVGETGTHGGYQGGSIGAWTTGAPGQMYRDRPNVTYGVCEGGHELSI